MAKKPRNITHDDKWCALFRHVACRPCGTSLKWCVPVLLSWLIVGCSSHLFYQPSPYPPEMLSALEVNPRLTQLSYPTGAGRQVVFYMAPAGARHNPPSRVWLLFGGLRSNALEWVRWLVGYSDPQAGFLLFEYPGYGLCEGYSRDHLILESSLAALDTLAKELAMPPKRLYDRLFLLGHSFGCAAALQLACEVPVRGLVLISPFTSLADMSRLQYGPVAGTLAHFFMFERYDNSARMKALASRPNPPPVTIIHGQADEIVPVWMARDLVRNYQALTAFHEIPALAHSGVFSNHLPLIHNAMRKHKDDVLK